VHAEFGVPDGTELPVQVVWGVLTGAGFLVLLGTGLLAWWLDRRSRRATAPERQRRPRGSRADRRARRAAPTLPGGTNGAAPAPAQVARAGLIDLDSVSAPGVPPRRGNFGVAVSGSGALALAQATGPSRPAAPQRMAPQQSPAARSTTQSRQAPPRQASGAVPAADGPVARPAASGPAVRSGRRGRQALEAALAETGREYADLRAAAARAATVAAQARQHSESAARVLDTAERVYEQARLVHELSRGRPLDATPGQASAGPAPAGGSDDVARAALDAYRRGELSAEDLRRVWYGTSGWHAEHEAAERESRRLQADEVSARQQYHLALAAARQARRAEYVADTAIRALDAEAAAAAAELTEVYDRIDGRRGRRRRRD
jgi:hypothetical protein